MAQPVEPPSLPRIQDRILPYSTLSRHSPTTPPSVSSPSLPPTSYSSHPLSHRIDSVTSPVLYPPPGNRDNPSPIAHDHGAKPRSTRPPRHGHTAGASRRSTPVKRTTSDAPSPRSNQSPARPQSVGSMAPPEQTPAAGQYQSSDYGEDRLHLTAVPPSPQQYAGHHPAVAAPTPAAAPPPPPPTPHLGYGSDLAQAAAVEQVLVPQGYGLLPHGYPLQATYDFGSVYRQIASTAKSKPLPRLARAQRACDKCRERKSKCDENRPSCNTCLENKQECTYRETTSKYEKVPVAAWEELQSSIHAGFDELKGMLKASGLPRLDSSEMADVSLSPDAKPIDQHIKRRRDSYQQASRPSSPSKRTQSPSHDTTAAGQTQSQDGASKAKDEQPPEEKQVLDKHVTAAHKLLYLWPSIHELASQGRTADSRDFRFNYVFHGEARGWLRVDGSGEDATENDIGTVPARDTSDTSNDASAAWTLPAVGTAVRPGGGDLLDLSPDRIGRLLAVYEKNFHIMHPFVDLTALHAFKSKVLEGMSATNQRLSTSFNATTQDSRPSKRRKLADGSSSYRAEPRPTPSSQPLTCAAYNRTPTAAIFFLVLALGEIAEHHGIIPGPSDDDTGSAATPRPTSYMDPLTPVTLPRPSPATSFTGTVGTPSSIAHIPSPSSSYGSPQSSMTVTRTARRNLDIIPGLPYYHEATQILGLYADSNELNVAQAKVLAGLFKGQLGRVQESYSWFCDSARMLRLYARLHDLEHDTYFDETTNEIKGLDTSSWAPHRARYLLTYWSALQLESDILAELDYPSSGLGAMTMPLPSLPNRACSDLWVMTHFNMQIWIRKELNNMHRNTYGMINNHAETIKSTHLLAEVLSEIEETLIRYRDLGMGEWRDEDPPSSDILVARLRGKYYGALYISLRPFLDYCLHAMEKVRRGASPASCSLDAFGGARPNHQDKFFEAIRVIPEEEVKDRARRCVRAAIRSTMAFDNVRGRQIVTNIAGTCHAQFSNMLVLCACSESRIDFLDELIPRTLLKRLLKRTIRFLSHLRLCSATAVADIEILQHLLQTVFHDTVQLDTHGDYREADPELINDATSQYLAVKVRPYNKLCLEKPPGKKDGRSAGESFSTDGGGGNSFSTDGAASGGRSVEMQL